MYQRPRIDSIKNIVVVDSCSSNYSHCGFVYF